MRAFALLITVLSATLASGAQPSDSERSYRFDKGLWFDGERFVKRTVYASERRLQFTPPMKVDSVVDLAGAYVIPPLCEAHNHNLGLDHENEKAIARYLADGVFYVKILSNLPRETGVVRHTYNHPGAVDVSFANGGITGSGGHPIRLREQLLERGVYEGFTREMLRDHAYFVVDTAADLDAKWPLVLQFRPDFIKAILVHSEEYAKRRDDDEYFGAKGLDPEVFPLLVARAHEARLRVSVHVNSAEDFHVAVTAGADEIAHLPGSRTVEHVERADAVLAAQKGITVVTTAVLIERQKEKNPELHASLRLAQIENLRLLHDARVTLAVGSDEYDDTSVGEVRHLRGLGVFEDLELLRMWTQNCARTVFPDRKVGRLDAGYEASFVGLDGNPLVDWTSLDRIRYRFKDGRPLAVTTKPASTLALSDCELPGVARTARCGALEVPENPDNPKGRRLSIGIAVIPAAAGPALRDPIVPLMGGPGEDAIRAAALFANLLAPLLEDRDLLLVDQRGTGRSGALRCDLYSADDPAASLHDLFPSDQVRRCERQLRARADLTQYTYVHFARDLEHVRRALGYESLNLFAGSYGTRAAQVYIRAHPRSVRTVYFWSVVPLDVPTPLTMAKTAQAAFERTLGACAAEPACNKAFPQLREDFQAALARLASGSVRVAVPGRTEPTPIHGGRVAEWFRSMLYRPYSSVNLPWIIHRAHTGDWGPVVEGILANARGADAGLSFGLFFSITCNEDVAFIREEDVGPATAGTVLGDYRLRQQQSACRDWPRVSLPPDYRTPVRSSVPALFVSGDSDAASPLWFTERVAPGFTNRAEVILGNRGHTEWDECVARLYEQFVRSGQVRDLDTSSCKSLPRPPFRTR